MPISNSKTSTFSFLKDMAADGYFPPPLVQKGQDILKRLCEEIESSRPSSLAELYALTHKATEEFNMLGAEFEDEGSELETAARENIGADFKFIAEAYGFDADIEELIAPREW
jgi:hypothetical protein